MDEFVMGRLSQSNQFGKCVNPVATELPDAVLEVLTMCYGLQGIPRAQFLRDLIINRLYGAVVEFPAADRTLEEAIQGLAFVHGCSVEEMKEKILTEYVFGLAYALKHSGEQNQDNAGNKIQNNRLPEGNGRITRIG